MTQSERRLYLIRELLKEQPQYQDIRIPAIRQEQKHLLRALFNVRMPAPVSDEFLEIDDGARPRNFDWVKSLRLECLIHDIDNFGVDVPKKICMCRITGRIVNNTGVG